MKPGPTPAPAGPGAAGLRVALVQAPMHWTTAANLAVILAALRHAALERRAELCVFSELAVTGFHREIRREAVPEIVGPAIEQVRTACAGLRIACGLGAPAFGPGGIVHDSYLLIDEAGRLAARVDKTGLTVAESTFFHAGRGRPVGVLQGRRVGAVLCREIEDTALVAHHLPRGAAELILWPSLMGRAPGPDDDPDDAEPDAGELASRLARRRAVWVVENNWPEALNLPPGSPDGDRLGGSRVIGPDGALRLRLPHRRAGLASFALGASGFQWDAADDIAGLRGIGATQ